VRHFEPPSAARVTFSLSLLGLNRNPWLSLESQPLFLEAMTAPPEVVGRVKPKTASTTSSAATTTATGAVSADKPKKETSARQHPNSQNAAVKLKVVVRGLPPNLPESVFIETTKEWINETTVDWYYYVAGKLHERYLCSFELRLLIFSQCE
jgi:hypothetical protein